MNSDLEALGRRQLASLERLWKDGAIPALMETMAVCSRCGLPLPEWAGKGILAVLDESASNKTTKLRGRNQAWLSRYRQDMIDMERHETIAKLREHGVPWKEVYLAASEILEDTDAHGASDTMEAAYKRFKKREKSQPLRYHVFSSYQVPSTSGRRASVRRLKAIAHWVKKY